MFTFRKNGHFYEKIGKKGEPTCIDDEIPFDIPDSWEWVKLGFVGEWGAGSTPKRGEPKYYLNGTIPWLKTGDLNNGYINEVPEYITELALKETSVRLNPIGSVLIAMYGATIGKVGILNIEATTNQACCACLPFDGIYNEFLFYYLMSQNKNFNKMGEGGAQPNISRTKIINYLFPIPPFSEQKRIVTKIKEILPLIDEYDINKEQLDKLNSDFPDKLKSSILQEAIQGKLVSQNPNDEPASVLLEKIREEKERLIKEKKIKRNKNESYIFKENNHFYEKIGKNESICIDDEIPFDIPNTWEWVRLNTISQINPRNKIDDGLDVSFIPMPLIDESYSNSYTYEIRKWKDIKKGYTHFAKNDIVIAKITPCFENLKSAIVNDLKNDYGAGTTELHVIRPYLNFSCLEYLLFLFKSPYFIKNGEKNFTGTAGQKRIGKKFVENFLIPVPPLLEQEKIVNKINCLFHELS